jgi:hypothetical protein
MLSTFPSYSLEESREWKELFHPGKIVRTLRFAKTFRGIDHKSANLYLLDESPIQDRVALYGLPDDIDYTTSMMANPRVSALKMYYSYLDPPATQVYQSFPKEVLEEAQDRDIPIILHPPRRITDCLSQLVQLVKDFPRLRVCLAHLSLTKTVVPGLEGAFSCLARFANVSFDTALVPSADVVHTAITIVGTDRIMYGSDEPLHLIRSVPFIHPQRGERITTTYPYHWVDLDEYERYKHLAIGAPHAHWQSLRAIRRAVERLPQECHQDVKRRIFHDNAKAFYGF